MQVIAKKFICLEQTRPGTMVFVPLQICPGTKILILCTGTNLYRYIHTNFVPGQRCVPVPSHFGCPGIEPQIVPGQLFILVPVRILRPV